jgi:hypothetical protein
MDKPMHAKGADPERHAKPRRLRKFLVVTATIALAAGLFAAAILQRGGEPQGGSLPASTAAQGSQVAPITVAADSGFGVLIGRWLRPDGGYVLALQQTFDVAFVRMK